MNCATDTKKVPCRLYFSAIWVLYTHLFSSSSCIAFVHNCCYWLHESIIIWWHFGNLNYCTVTICLFALRIVPAFIRCRLFAAEAASAIDGSRQSQQRLLSFGWMRVCQFLPIRVLFASHVMFCCSVVAQLLADLHPLFFDIPRYWFLMYTITIRNSAFNDQ